MATYEAVNAAVTAIVAAVNTQIALIAPINGISILVCEGPPGTYEPDDMVVIAEHIAHTAQPHQIIGTGSFGWLLEEFRVSVTVDVYRGGDDAATVRSRCLTLANAVDTAIRVDPSLAGSVFVAWPVEHRYESSFDPDNKGRRMTCEIAILCRAVP